MKTETTETTAPVTMTAYNLRQEVVENNPHSKFFSPENMRAHGDTMSNYGVRSAGRNDEVWELYRKRPVRPRGLRITVQTSAYFCKSTYQMRWAYHYDCFAESLSAAESWGWTNWLDDVDDDTDPQTIDAAEADALDHLESVGKVVIMPD